MKTPYALSDDYELLWNLIQEGNPSKLTFAPHQFAATRKPYPLKSVKKTR